MVDVGKNLSPVPFPYEGKGTKKRGGLRLDSPAAGSPGVYFSRLVSPGIYQID